MSVATKQRGVVSPPYSEQPLFFSKEELKQALPDLLRRHSQGHIARATRCAKQTVKEWKAGDAVPTGAPMLNMVMNLPNVREWALDRARVAREGAANGISTLKELATYDDHDGDIARKALAILRAKGIAT